MSIEAELRTPIVITVGLLVNGEYEALANMAGGEQFTAANIQEIVDDYGMQLAMPPGDFPAGVELYPVEGVVPRRVAADIPLWTKEEGRSDLTLELMLTEAAPGLWTVRITNIHVM
jgi:hypothetical protein